MKRFLAILGAALFLGAAEVPVAPLGAYPPAERRHWAFQPRKDPPPPTFTAAADRAWVKTSVDALIPAALNKAGLKPASAADRPTLIRRVTFDLTGLPPTAPYHIGRRTAACRGGVAGTPRAQPVGIEELLRGET
jgi:hypothetical protein